jgi:PAS domain S-box-containing protein
MKKQEKRREKADSLFKKYEGMASQREIELSDTAPATEAEMLKLIHELQTHQAELQLQNSILLATLEKQSFSTAINIAEQKQMDEYLQKYRNIVSSSPDGIAFLDQNYRYVVVNDAYEKFSAKSREVLLGMTVSDYLGEDVFQLFVKPNFDKCLQGNVINYQEWFTYPKLGKRFVDVTYFPYRDNDNSIVGIISNTRDITDRKQMETALHENEERLRLALKATNDVVWDWDIVNDLHRWNDAGAKVFGWTEIVENFVNSTWWLERIHPDDRARVEHGFISAVQNTLETHWQDEYRFMKADCTYTEVIDRANVLRDSKGKAIRMIGAMLDVSERRKAEKLIRDNEHKFRTVADFTSDMEYWWLPNGELKYISPSCERITGYARHEFISNPDLLIKIVHPDDLDAFIMHSCSGNLAAIDYTEKEIVFRIIKKDLEIVWIEHICRAVFDDNNNYLGRRVSNRDITQRKKAELDLQIAKEQAEISEERFNLAMKASNDGLFDRNLETNEIYYSPAWKKMLGYEEHELSNEFSVWENTTDPDDVKKSLELQQKLINKEIDRYVVELKMKHKNGYWVDILSRAEVIFDDTGKAVRFIGTHTDISERKQAERERQEKAELEKKIQLSEESLKFKQSFLANMSHEIRTPLTGIMGMAEILSKTKLDNEQADYLNTILISGDNLKEIINNVLDFSKIEAGKMQLKKKVFPLQNIYDTAESLFKSTCKKPLTFKSTIDPLLPELIKSDENRIKQIINNLISNAVKFTSVGEIHLLAQLNQRMPVTGLLEIKISVSDTGEGIPDYLQEMLFRPFSQVGNHDIRQFEGTGLGLSICKNLSVMLGGEIGVQSSLNNGSTFWFTFLAEEVCDRIDTEAITNGWPAVKNTVRLRILLAEDKLITQKVIKLQLSSLGHEVTIAENGQKALDVFEPQKFDLILMDIQMPVMDGITAVQTLKKMYDHLPPIIGLSANAFEGDREKYIKQGMDEYLTKPFVVDDFVMLMDELFGKKLDHFDD